MGNVNSRLNPESSQIKKDYQLYEIETIHDYTADMAIETTQRKVGNVDSWLEVVTRQVARDIYSSSKEGKWSTGLVLNVNSECEVQTLLKDIRRAGYYCRCKTIDSWKTVSIYVSWGMVAESDRYHDRQAKWANTKNSFYNFCEYAVLVPIISLYIWTLYMIFSHM
jgi:hypothetical protein